MPQPQTARAPHQEGGGEKKGKRKATQSPLPLPFHVLITPPPSPRRKMTTYRVGHAASQVGDGTKNKRRKIRRVANIAPSTEGTASHMDRQTTFRTPSSIVTRSGQGGYRSGCARKPGSISRSTTSAPNDGVGIGTRPREITTHG